MNTSLGAEWVIATLVPWALSPHPNFGQKEVSAPGALALVAEFRSFSERERYDLVLEPHEKFWAETLLEQAEASLVGPKQEDAVDALWSVSLDPNVPVGAQVAASLFASVALGDLDREDEAVARLRDLVDRLRAVSSKSPAVAMMEGVVLQHTAARLQDLSRFREAAQAATAALDALPKTSARNYEKFAVSQGISWRSARVQRDLVEFTRQQGWATRASLEGISGNLWTRVVRSRQSWLGSRLRIRAAERQELFLRSSYEEAFDALSGRVTFGGSTPYQAGLSALLLAELAGSTGLRSERETQGQLLLLQQPSGVDESSEALRLLRKSGSTKALQPATQWMRNQGPSSALSAAARTVLKSATRRGAVTECDLLVLEAASDFLNASELSEGLDAAFAYGRTERVWGKVGWAVRDRTWKAVSRLLPGSQQDLRVARIAAEDLLSNSVDQVTAGNMASALSVMQWSQLDADVRRDMDAWLRSDASKPDELRYLRSVVAQNLESQLPPISPADELERLALRLDSNDDKLSGEDAADAEAMLKSRMRAEAEEAERGVTSIGGLSPVDVAVAYSVMTEGNALWGEIAEFIVNDKIDNALKSRALERVARWPQKVPRASVKILAANWEKAAALDSAGFFGAPNPLPVSPPHLRVAAALGIFNLSTAMEQVMLLAAAGEKGRVEAARSVPFAIDLGDPVWGHVLLLQMSYDDSPDVRAAAGSGLVATSGHASPLTSNAIERATQLLSSDGVRVPLGVLRGVHQLVESRSSLANIYREAIRGRELEGSARLVREAATQILTEMGQSFN